jgi:hypothetical protein
VPTDSDEVEKLALPPVSVPLPILTPPSLKVTLPVGVPTPGATALSVAVNVTVCPNTNGFTDDVTVVELDAWFTVCNKLAEVEFVKFVSPA